jgi:hypothetical protein
MRRETAAGTVLAISFGMKGKMKFRAGLLWAAFAFSLATLPILSRAEDGLAQLKQESPVSPGDKQAITLFKNRIKDYIKLRSKVKRKLPRLSKDSTPEQLESFRKSFEESLRAARAGAKRGDVFTPAAADYIRRTLRTEFKGDDRAALREIVFEAETSGVPLRVNYPYPETRELTEMPPTLLLRLPQLPTEVKYRFVGRNMLLVDRDNNLIIDYMVDALP